jgi:hypothetical protein
MKVRLKDTIISELTSLGLRPGMVVSATQVNKTTGAVDFTHYYNSAPYDCVVWPEDYEIVEDEKATATPEIADWVNQISKDIPNEIQLPITEVTNALDAMYWSFSAYLGDSDLTELPWIVNLIKSYNSIVRSLPSPWNLQYEPVEY